jgi:hypothetical protein
MDPHKANCSGWSQCDKDTLQKEAMRKSKVSAKENIESLKEKPGLHRLKKS